MTSEAVARIWSEVAARAVDPSAFWPLRRLPPATLTSEQRAILDEATGEFSRRADGDLFVFTAPEIAQACLLAVPDYDDAIRFIGVMRSSHANYGSFLTERWYAVALQRFDRLTQAWSSASAAQALLWPDEAAIPSPPSNPSAVLRWVESKQSAAHADFGPLLHEVSEAESELLARRSIGLLDAGGDPACAAVSLLLAIACWGPRGLSSVHHDLLHRGVLNPGVLYRNAGPIVAAELLALIREGNDRNHGLMALAWTHSDVAARQFAAWRTTPPSWSPELLVPAHAYAHEGGWATDSSGNVRPLCATTAKQLVPVADGEVGLAVATFSPSGSDVCPWCGDPLTSAFDLHLDRTDLTFLGLGTGWIRIVTCERCTAFGPVFSDIDRQGGARWSSDNVRPEYLADGEWIHTATQFRLGPTMVTAVETLASDDRRHRSQLGGHPSWDQDAQFPICPRCAEPMYFIGQIDYSDADDNGEGMLYAFVDADCLMAATTYQQT